MVDSQITILGFGWTKSTANSASASKALMYYSWELPSPLFSCCVLEKYAQDFVSLLSFGDTSQYNVLDRFHDFHITLSLNNVERTSLEISFQTGDKKPFSLSQNIRKQSCLNLDEHHFVAHIAVSLNATIVLHFINL